MNDEILFEEHQRFSQWWVWLILLLVNTLIAWGVYKQLVLGDPFGNKPMSDGGLLRLAAASIVISILFFSLRLDTQIKEDGIYVRFFPFHLTFKHFSWGKLSKSFVRTYSPISEYGGWGLRLGLFGKGKAFNVSGDKGLQLMFMDNRKLLIGTQKPEDVRKALLDLGQLKE